MRAFVSRGGISMAHILVVDDDETVRTFAGRMLEFAGHTVSRATGGREALALLEIRKPDLILSDIKMPEIDGLDLFREVRLCYPELPFIGMSGDFSKIYADVPFDAFLSKPFGLDDLTRTVEEALAGQMLVLN